MSDPIFNAFLTRQLEEGLALARSSDILALFPQPVPVPGQPPSQYVAEFKCRGLVKDPLAGVIPAERFAVGIRFPHDYLRRVDPGQAVCLLFPHNVWHPNVHAPFICVGRLRPGTPLVDSLYQLFEIFTWNRYTLADPLNPEASQWARANMDRNLFPTDRRPLKRQASGRQTAVGGLAS